MKSQEGYANGAQVRLYINHIRMKSNEDLEAFRADLQRLRVALILGTARRMVLRGQIALRRRNII